MLAFLNRLTPGGWVILGLMVLFDLKFAFEAYNFVASSIAVSRGQKVRQVHVSLLAPVVFTLWFLYLIS